MMKKFILKHMIVGILFVAMCHNCCGGFLGDCANFLSAFARSPKNVGSVIPSSRFLARAMTRHIFKGNRSLRILEVGAGTGVVTEQIIKKMGSDDTFDIVEMDPHLCEVMEKKFANYSNVHVHCISILDWNPACEYDYIVSMLPFSSFDAQTVDTILEQFEAMTKNNGIISYVELIAMSGIRKTFLRGDKKRDFITSIDHKSAFRKKYEFDKDVVMLNIPPARVYHLKIRR